MLKICFFFSDLGILPPECSDTASLLHFMDDIFDSVNGSETKNYHAKPLLGPVTPTSEHHKKWIESIKIFKTMKFVNAAGKVYAYVPTINNWVWTLEAIEVLLKKLQIDHDVTSVWLRHLNQDPLENFFGAIRSHGCRNNNPTCDQFENSYATLLINNLNSGYIRGKNCEGDFCDALHALLITENSEAKSTETLDFSEFIDMELLSIQQLENDPTIMAPLEYVNGYFLKKLKSKIFKGCHICSSKLMAPEGHESKYIKFREYAGRRWLCYPSNDFNKLLIDIKHIIYEILKKNIYKKLLKECLKTTVLAIADFNVFNDCQEHRKKNIDFIINILIRFMIYNSCKNINKIMTGKIKIYDVNDQFQLKANKICENSKKNH